MKNFFLILLLIILNIANAQSKAPVKIENVKLRIKVTESEYIPSVNDTMAYYRNHDAVYNDVIPEISYKFWIGNDAYLIAYFESYGESYENSIVLYKSFANTWSNIQQLQFDSGEVKKGFEFFISKGQIYPYLEIFYRGGAANNATYSFAFYDIKKNKLIELKYHGYNYYEQIRHGEFDMDDLVNEPTLLKFLEQKAANAKVIFRE